MPVSSLTGRPRRGLLQVRHCPGACGPFAPVGADNAFTSCDLRILMEDAKPVASENADVIAGRRDVGLPVGWSLAEGPVRPVGVVVIDVFAESVVQVSPAGDEDAVDALAPRTGDPPLADRVRPRRPDGRGDDSHAGRGEDSVERAVLRWPIGAPDRAR
jgi:hypothetical protein